MHSHQMRHFAIEFAQEIISDLSTSQLQLIADALNGSYEKALNCSVVIPAHVRTRANRVPPRAFEVPESDITFFVDALKGNDNNPGTQQKPFQTIAKAVAATRNARATQTAITPRHAPNATIVLRAGTFYLHETIQLGAADSGLTLQSYQDEVVWISGAKPLTNLKWKPADLPPTTTRRASAPIWVADLSSIGLTEVKGLRLAGQRLVRARWPNGDPELGMFGCIPEPPQHKGVPAPCPKSFSRGNALRVDNSAWNSTNKSQSLPAQVTALLSDPPPTLPTPSHPTSPLSPYLPVFNLALSAISACYIARDTCYIRT